MLKKIRKFTRKHLRNGKGKGDRLPADSSSAPPARWARNTPYLTQSATPPQPRISSPCQIPERNRVYQGSSGDYVLKMEKRRTGSPYGYTQSLGDVWITNPDLTSASPRISPASTSANLLNYNPSPLSNLMTAAHHRKPSPPSESNVSTASNLSRVSVADDFLPMNDDLTAAVFTSQVIDESEESEEHEFEAQSPRVAMNPLGLNPPNTAMANPPQQESSTPLYEQADVGLPAPLPFEPRYSSRPGLLPRARNQEDIRMPANSTRAGIASRRSSSIGFYPHPRENAMTSKDNPIHRRPSSSSGPYRSTPLEEHLQKRIRQRRFSGRHGPLTTAEFPETLQTLGPYARFPKFTRSSGYKFPHDEPFLFSNDGVPAQDRDHDSRMSANLTRPAVLDYTVYRKSNSSLVFVDYPNEPDKDIYTRPVKLNRPPISYMHTRYPRQLPSQLVVGAPFPSRGPVSSPPFCRRVSHSFVGAPRRRRLTKARVGPVEQTFKCFKSRRQSQLQSHGSIRPASRSQKVRKYHAYVYNSVLETGRKWNDYTIIESSRENSLGDMAAMQRPEAVSAAGHIASPTLDTEAIAPTENATTANTASPSTCPTVIPEAFSIGNANLPSTPHTNAAVPLQTRTSGSTTSAPTPLNRNLSIPPTPRKRSLVVPRQDSARLRHRRSPRLASLGLIAAQWLQQNNTNPSPPDLVNVP